VNLAPGDHRPGAARPWSASFYVSFVNGIYEVEDRRPRGIAVRVRDLAGDASVGAIGDELSRDALVAHAFHHGHEIGILLGAPHHVVVRVEHEKRRRVFADEIDRGGRIRRDVNCPMPRSSRTV
jgi:hypothetical protein